MAFDTSAWIPRLCKRAACAAPRLAVALCLTACDGTPPSNQRQVAQRYADAMRAALAAGNWSMLEDSASRLMEWTRAVGTEDRAAALTEYVYVCRALMDRSPADALTATTANSEALDALGNLLLLLAHAASTCPAGQDLRESYLSLKPRGVHGVVYNLWLGAGTMNDLVLPPHQVCRFDGHRKWVRAVSFVGDGRYVASGGDDSVIRVWSAEDGRAFASLAGHQGTVFTVKAFNDGDLLISGGEDSTVRTWDLRSCSEVGQLGPLNNDSIVQTVALAQTGMIAFADGPCEIDGGPIFDLTSVYPLLPIDHYVTSLAMNRAGTLLAAGLFNGHAYAWSVVESRPIGEFPESGGPVAAVALSPDDRLLAVGSTRTLNVWDIQSRTLVFQMHDDVVSITALAFSPDGRFLAIGDQQSLAVLLMDLQGRRHSLIGHRGGILSLDFSPDGTRLVSGSCDRTARVWDVTHLEW